MKHNKLYILLINFDETERDSLPSSRNFAENYRSDETLRQKIEQMLNADAVRKFYAAVLLWEVDKSKATEVLYSLTNDKTKILIQAPVGFRGVMTNVALAARDFLENQSVRGINFYKELTLDNWAKAVWEERRNKALPNELNLPKQIDVLEALESEVKKKELLAQAEKLAHSTPSEKFYAAALFENFDKEKATTILESMLSEEDTIWDFSGGDDIDILPAKVMARRMLYGNLPPQNEKSETENHSLLDWFWNLFGSNK